MESTYTGSGSSGTALVEVPPSGVHPEVALTQHAGVGESWPQDEAGIAQKVYTDAVYELYDLLTPTTGDEHGLLPSSEVYEARKKARELAERRRDITLEVHRLEGPEGAQIWADYQALDTLLRSHDETDWDKAVAILDRWEAEEHSTGTVAHGAFTKYFNARLETNPQQHKKYNEQVSERYPDPDPVEEPEPAAVADDPAPTAKVLTEDKPAPAAGASVSRTPQGRGVYRSVFGGGEDAVDWLTPEEQRIVDAHRNGEGPYMPSAVDALTAIALHNSIPNYVEVAGRYEGRNAQGHAARREYERLVALNPLPRRRPATESEPLYDADGDRIVTGGRLLDLFPGEGRSSRAGRHAARRRRIDATTYDEETGLANEPSSSDRRIQGALGATGRFFVGGARRLQRLGQRGSALVSRVREGLRPEPTSPDGWQAMVEDLRRRRGELSADGRTEDDEPNS